MPKLMQAAAEMELSDEATSALRADMPPHDAVKALLNQGLTTDALKLLARLLPARYAVAWLCQCAKGQPLPDDDKLGASLAGKWVRDPSETNRRAAYEFALADGFKSLGAWLAVAAGWSGGSLAPASQEAVVPPPEYLTAKATVAAIALLAMLVQEEYEARRAGFAQQALTLLAPGGNAAAGSA